MAFILGLLPALLWMWFWLKEDIHPEPAKMLTLSFLGGMLAVPFVIPLQKLVYVYFADQITISFLLWAAIEEIFKFGLIYVIALRNRCTDEPLDDIIYLIVGALGFVTLENTLFLTELIRGGNLIDTIINLNLRFIGASLLHVISSATIGICLALSFYKHTYQRLKYAISGIIIAIALHTSFNLFIINGAPGSIFFIFGMVWVGIIILLLLFEKVKHMKQGIQV